MARSIRDNELRKPHQPFETGARGKPYTGPHSTVGVRQDYRRNKTGNGSWVARVADGNGSIHQRPSPRLTISMRATARPS